MKTSLEILKDLIRIPSISSDQEQLHKVCDYVVNAFKDIDITIERFEFNGKPSLLIYNGEQKRHFKFIFNGHLDVVPAKSEIFSPQEKDGKVYGRGSYDMKASIAVLVELFSTLAKNKNLPDDIALMLVTDEEVDGSNGTGSLLKHEKVTCDFMLAGEPTDFDICVRQKGVIVAKVTSKGQAAHGAMPWEGENAIIPLAANIAKFYQDHPLPVQEAWETTYDISIIEAGTGINVVPEQATAFIDIRRTEADTEESILDLLRQYYTDCEISIQISEPHLLTQPDNPYVSKFKAVAQSLLGNEVRFRDVHFASDGRYYSSIGVPVINFGIKGGKMHQDEEYVEIESMQTYYAILEAYITKKAYL